MEIVKLRKRFLYFVKINFYFFRLAPRACVRRRVEWGHTRLISFGRQKKAECKNIWKATEGGGKVGE